MPSLCLNMIVKNESRIIKRLLDSVQGIIDSFCICDTGSEDSSVAIIEEFARNSGKIPYLLIQEPFQNFEHNRNVALRACQPLFEQGVADFVLLLDADMILEILCDPVVWKERTLCRDTLLLFQGNRAHFHFKNIRIVRYQPDAVQSGKLAYKGITHEYMHTLTPIADHFTVSMDELFIRDIGDGGSKSNKSARDKLFLERALQEDPHNVRYVFYYANTLSEMGDVENAIVMYKKRIDLGGWNEEQWYSANQLGHLYANKNNMPEAFFWWMRAIALHPNRLENVYQMVKYCRMHRQYQMAYLLCQYALEIIEGSNQEYRDYMFVQPSVYQYDFLYEMSVIGYYYNPKRRDIAKDMVLMLQRCPESSNSFSNYKFYAPCLADIQIRCVDPRNWEVLFSVGESWFYSLEATTGQFVRSTPSLVAISETQWILCQRYVNYKIDSKTGQYLTLPKIESVNWIALIDVSLWSCWRKTEEWRLDFKQDLKEKEKEKEQNQNQNYLGIEDIRLLAASSNHIHAIGQTGWCEMRYFDNIRLSSSSFSCSALMSPYRREQEKNWVLFEDLVTKEIKVVYEWFPFTIAKFTSLERNAVEIESKVTTNTLFKSLRGSSCGVYIKTQNQKEIWFLCHLVSYEERRYYYHVFVTIDAETYRPLRIGKPFTFQRNAVEYSLGFVYLLEKQQLIVGFSEMDAKCSYLVLPFHKIEEAMSPVV